MALIQYNLEENNGKYTVTHEVLEIDEGDRVQFKTKIPDAAIKYETDPPFTATEPNQKLPKANEPFRVNKSAGPFKVDKDLKAKNRILFDCGEAKEVKKVAVGESVDTPELEFTSWKTGDGHPPNHN